MQKLTVCVLFSKSWYPCGKMGTHRQTAYTGTFCEVCFCYSVSFLRGNVQTIKGSPHTNKQANQHTNNKTKHYGNIDQYENMSLQDEKHKKPINMQNLEKKNCTNKNLDKITHLFNGMYCRWRHEKEFPKHHIQSLNLLSFAFSREPFHFQ